MEKETQNIVYRIVQPQDSQAVAELERQCFGDEAWSIQLFAAEFQDATKRYFVATDKNQIVAYGGYAHIIDEAHIMNIAVAGAYRQKGIAQQILEHLIADAKSRGITAMTLEVKSNNQAAKALYEKNQFVLHGVRKKYYKNTHDALIYWKQL
jgi:ribosomal-protein-alanine N-acetyltransferase